MPHIERAHYSAEESDCKHRSHHYAHDRGSIRARRQKIEQGSLVTFCSPANGKYPRHECAGSLGETFRQTVTRQTAVGSIMHSEAHEEHIFIYPQSHLQTELQHGTC